MAVLSDVDIRRIIEEDEILILNKREKSITGVGYDLMIGFIRDADTGEVSETYAEDSSRYVLTKGHRYVVISREFLYIPEQYMATLHSRGSYALKGIITTSTTVDPNYIGCITGALYNCSSEDIYIKKDNSFATMVIHQLCTPTDKRLTENEFKRVMDAQETFHSKYPNIHKDTREAGDLYYGKIRKEIEYEYTAALARRMAKKTGGPSDDLKKGTARVTFLVGNGFDLNIGLKTRYSDFYEYYITNNPDDLLANEIKKDIDKWAELESEIGKYTENVTSSNEKQFEESEKNLEVCLTKYLKMQMSEIDLRGEEKRRKIGSQMRNALTEFYSYFPIDVKKEIENILTCNKNRTRYSFISFNYTDALDEYLKTMKEREESVHYFRVVDEVLHIHGTVYESMVLGVNDENQIANERFRFQPEKSQLLIKKEIIKLCGNNRVGEAQAVIDDSSLICIFGMSIGETDKMWWQYLAKWLQTDQDRRLIIFAKDDAVSRKTKYVVKTQNDMKGKFRKNAELMPDIWKQIERQIHVEVNAEIFNFE